MRFFLAAGEASGDALAAAMMPYFPENTAFHGIGGSQMEAAGLESLFPIDELSVMGIAEILPRAPQLLRRVRETAEAVADLRPDALITIDSPDFATRVAKRVAKLRPEIPRVHYVAPTVWAWRAGRAKKFAEIFNHLLAVLPFEPPYFEAEGLSCDFVGHPVVSLPDADPAEVAALKGDRPRVLVLPGSRNSEIKRLAPVFNEVSKRLLGARVLTLAAPGREAALWELMPEMEIITPRDNAEKYALFAAADVALAASGTVSLELARYRTPMVIAYDANWLTQLLLRRMVKIDTATLINLLTERREIPEYLFENCTVEKILPAVSNLLKGDAAAQHEVMAESMRLLGEDGPPPGQRAAESVLNYLNRR
ncbi:lipid-A-disaccharide synthase [Paracoccaceae bacterium GXU_MW_L88]